MVIVVKYGLTPKQAPKLAGDVLLRVAAGIFRFS